MSMNRRSQAAAQHETMCSVVAAELTAIMVGDTLGATVISRAFGDAQPVRSAGGLAAACGYTRGGPVFRLAAELADQPARYRSVCARGACNVRTRFRAREDVFMAACCVGAERKPQAPPPRHFAAARSPPPWKPYQGGAGGAGFRCHRRLGSRPVTPGYYNYGMS